MYQVDYKVQIEYYKVIPKNSKRLQREPTMFRCNFSNFENFTPLDALKIHFQRLFAIREL